LGPYQAQALALKAERLLRTGKAGKTPYSHTEDSSRSYSHIVEEETAQPKAKQLVPKQARGKSRAKHVSKCYRCGEEGHVSSNYTLRKFVNTRIHDGEDY